MRSVILKIHLHMQRHRCACYCITELTLTVTRTTGTSSVNCIGLCTLSTLVNDTFIELWEDHFQIYIYIRSTHTAASSWIYIRIYIFKLHRLHLEVWVIYQPTNSYWNVSFAQYFASDLFTAIDYTIYYIIFFNCYSLIINYLTNKIISTKNACTYIGVIAVHYGMSMALRVFCVRWLAIRNECGIFTLILSMTSIFCNSVNFRFWAINILWSYNAEICLCN